jgi:hypothetical protein
MSHRNMLFATQLELPVTGPSCHRLHRAASRGTVPLGVTSLLRSCLWS